MSKVLCPKHHLPLEQIDDTIEVSGSCSYPATLGYCDKCRDVVYYNSNDTKQRISIGRYKYEYCPSLPPPQKTSKSTPGNSPKRNPVSVAGESSPSNMQDIEKYFLSLEKSTAPARQPDNAQELKEQLDDAKKQLRDVHEQLSEKEKRLEETEKQLENAYAKQDELYARYEEEVKKSKDAHNKKTQALVSEHKKHIEALEIEHRERMNALQEYLGEANARDEETNEEFTQAIDFIFELYKKMIPVPSFPWDDFMAMFEQLLPLKFQRPLLNKFTVYNNELKMMLQPVTFIDKPLYICGGPIKCEIHQHRVERVTAAIDSVSGKTVNMTVNHCTDCDLYFTTDEIFSTYVKNSGQLLGYFIQRNEMTIGSTCQLSGNLAPRSVLNIYGYNVNQKENLTPEERRRILTYVIERNIMEQGSICSFLEWIINRQKNTEHPPRSALERWRSDLQWVNDYHISEQDRVWLNGFAWYRDKNKH